MDSLDTGKTVFTARRLFTVTLISFGYLLLSYCLVGFKSDQIYLVALFTGCYFGSSLTRKFITGFSIFIVFWIIFDYMKAFPNYLFREVHIESLYQTEKNIFGIYHEGRWLTPNEFWLFHQYTWLDILTGVFYLCWIPVPLAFAAYLFFRNRTAFLHFSLNFLLVNLIGFVIYYIYPAAPPWYVQQHGFTFIASTPGSTGGLARFDHFFHRNIFQNLYSKSSNVFAAMPSLHASYPVMVLYYGIKNKLGRINWLFGLVMLGIWFSAIYNSHHYMLDVLAGIGCAITGIYVFEWLKEKKAIQSFLQMFVRSIT